MPFMIICIIFWFIVVSGSNSTDDHTWYKGCFQPVSQNVTKFNVSSHWDGPAQCTKLCAHERWKLAAVQGNSTCYCLQTLQWHNKVDSVKCSFKCAQATHLRCGGHETVAIFNTSLQVILNISISSPSHVDIANVSEFSCKAVLMSSRPQNETNNASDLMKSNRTTRQFVTISWRIDLEFVKLSNRTTNDIHLNDILYHRFTSTGAHSVCCNVSNKHSWLSKCLSVFALERIKTLQLVNIHGGQNTPKGRYSIPQHTLFHVDIVLNAHSFAKLSFDFGDETMPMDVTIDYSRIKKNCSCLALTRKHYSYRKRGLFTLNITASNELSSSSVVFPEKFLVDGRITGVKILTQFAIAGKVTKIIVDTKGLFAYSYYEWVLDYIETKSTSEPFIEVNFPRTKPQYHIKVTAYNNVSSVEEQKMIFIEPEIKELVLAVSTNVSSINSRFIFTATPIIDDISFTPVFRYTWELRGRETLPGSLPNLIYIFKTAGRFQARVRVENYVSHVYSNNITVHVYDIITEVNILYKPFLFGETTELLAVVKDASDLTYSWEFGDGNKLVTSNSTVFHNYTRRGTYTVKVTAKNPVSMRKDQSKLFVVSYYCEKPIVKVTSASYLENLPVSSKLQLDVDVIVNCSVSNKTLYQWKVFHIKDGNKMERTHLDIGISHLVFTERSLILPPYSLPPGKYSIELMVKMEGTIIQTHINKLVNILPSKVTAIIKGGTKVLISRKSHENVTLDASESYDPDDKGFRNLSYNWVCKSVLHNGFGDCFRPNTTFGINFTLPYFQFLPRILVKSSSEFAFMVTVSRNGLKRSTAIQFIEVEEATVRRLQIVSPDLQGSDVNSHKDIKFKGICNDCGNTPILYQWTVHFTLKSKVNLKHFEYCVAADGSDYEKTGGLNGTNTTSTATTKQTSPATTMTSTPVVMTTVSPTNYQSGFQFFCESEMENLRKNWTGLNQISRKRREIVGKLVDFQTEEYPMERAEITWESIDDEKDETIDESNGIQWHAKQPERRTRREVNNGTVSNIGDGSSSGTGAFGTGGFTSGTGGAVSHSGGFTHSEAGYGPSDDGTGTTTGSDSVGFPSTSGSGRGPSGSGSGSVQPPPYSRGTGRGCEGSLGITGGVGLASGGSGGTGGCSGNTDGFGEGAKTHENRTNGSNVNGTTDPSGGSSENLVTEDRVLLQDKLKMVQEIVNQPVSQTDVHWGFDSDEFIIKRNTLIPGQLFKVEFIAFWQDDDSGRIAGKASQFFLTNTGPFLGNCKIEPAIGIEVKTVFTMLCEHWKDKHYPLIFSIKYRSLATHLPVLIYSGLESRLNFTLPAGNSSNNYTIDIEITIKDTEGVKTELCPIELQVLPHANGSLSFEEELYSNMIGNDYALKTYEDVSDKHSAIIFISNVANSLNSLGTVQPSNVNWKFREKIRTRLLQSINYFNINRWVFALQISGLTREITTRTTEVSLSSVELANIISEKIVRYHEMEAQNIPKDVTVEIGKDLFAVISNAISSTSHDVINDKSDNMLIRRLVKQSVNLHDRIIQILRNSTVDQLTLNGDFLTTSFKPFGHKQGMNGVFSRDGCLFMLPDNLKTQLENSSNIPVGSYSKISVYKRNPFRWGKNNSKIGTKVASLDFVIPAGSVVKVSNLSQPITVKLPVNKKLEGDVRRFSVKNVQMNMHQFNLTKTRSTLFVKLEQENADELNEHYAIQAVIRFDQKPTQRIYNMSLNLIENKAAVKFSPETVEDASTVFVGVFLKALGKVAKTNHGSMKRTYTLHVYSVDCRFWDEESDDWSERGCEETSDSNTSEIVCRCNHLTAFGGIIEVYHQTLTVSSLIDFKSDDEHFHILAIILTVVIIYLFLMVLCGFGQNSKCAYTNIAVLPDNHPADLFKYLVIVETGSSVNAGTTGRVSLIIYGQEGHSQIRELTCYDAEQFKRGSTNCVIMSFPDSLGDIKKIRLWHDNGGYSPDWFLKQITILDCQSHKKWYFHWNDWLAISENSTADCEIASKMEPLHYNLQTIFESFLDYHVWFSIFTRPTSSKFTSFQRVVVSLTILVGYMLIIAVYLHCNKEKVVDVLEIWDVKHLAMITSIIAASTFFPFQILIESLFRKTTMRKRYRKCDEEKREVNRLPDEDITKPSGAVFFMELNSSNYGSENVLHKDNNDSMQPAKKYNGGPIDKTFSLLPTWFDKLLILFCFLVSTSGIGLVFLYSLSFKHKVVTLWTQAFILSLLHSIFILEIVKAFCLSLRRIYKLSRDAHVKEFLNLFQSHDKPDQFNYISDDLTEKQIMAIRARARFVRFSKPILGKDLKKARKKATPLKILSSYAWHALTSCFLLVTIILIMTNSDARGKYFRNKSMKDLLASPGGNISFENISSVEQFWDWSRVRLVDSLNWNNWHHLRTFSDSNFDDVIYTFGPARMIRKDSKQSTVHFPNNLSEAKFPSFENSVLLIGHRLQMIEMLNSLQSSKWISNHTSFAQISFVHFHAQTNLFSNINLLINVSPVGRLITSIEIDVVSLFFKWNSSAKFLLIMQVLCVIIIILSFRNEFSSIMDKGIAHLKSFWTIIEGILIIAMFSAIIVHICFQIASKKALYQLDSMQLNDVTRFLDLQYTVYIQKVLVFLHATLFFLVVLRCLKLFRFWRRFSIFFLTLNQATTAVLFLVMMTSVVVFALVHMMMIITPFSHSLNILDIACQTLWLSKEDWNSRKDVSGIYHISPPYKLFAGLVLFALWRMSAVLYIGHFKTAKSVKIHQYQLLKAFKIGLRKLKSKKTWMQIFSNIWSKWFQKQEERYKVCNLPLENVYEEIEYQVEEVLFRLNNLFDMDGRDEKLSEDDDDLTLDSSDEAAYPSSYSTKDSISFVSESLYSEDSGYYRFGEYRHKSSPGSNIDVEFEGPIIHHLEPSKQVFSELGQKLTPIFGGRYFVKTSWSTFRAPKIQPGSVKMEPPPKILPPIRKSNSTFEKVSNWSNKFPMERNVDTDNDSNEAVTSDLFMAKSEEHEANYFEDLRKQDGQSNFGMVSFTNQPHKLPKALQSMAHKLKFVPTFNEHNTPFQLPPKLSTLSASHARGRNRLNLHKRSQIAPLRIDSPRSLSISSENSTAEEPGFPSQLKAYKPKRAPSIDSGIIQTSGIEDIESH